MSEKEQAYKQSVLTRILAQIKSPQKFSDLKPENNATALTSEVDIDALKFIKFAEAINFDPIICEKMLDQKEEALRQEIVKTSFVYLSIEALKMKSNYANK